MKQWLYTLITCLAIITLSKGFIEELKLPETFTECLQKQKLKNNGTASFEATNKWCINSHRMRLTGLRQRYFNISQDTTLWINELLRMSNVDVQLDPHTINKRQAVQIPPIQTQDVFNQVQFPSQPLAGQGQTQQNQQFQSQPPIPPGPQNPFDSQQNLPQNNLQQAQLQPGQANVQQIQIPPGQTNVQQVQIPSGQVNVQQVQIPQGQTNNPQVPFQPVPGNRQQPIPRPQGNPRPRRLRVRKEYRMMTDQERENFHRAILMLKADTSIQPNRYDVLAIVHFRMVDNIHHGGAFLAWHRIFITIMENALRQKIPDVTLPFWDSTMDSAMGDPTQSNIWTPDFMGNGDGLVNTGPFAFWQTPSGPLIRNLGQAGGGLFTRQAVLSILSRTRMAEITEPAAPDLYNVENYHGDAHTWIGGQMEPMETSAFDPIFFLHHAFVDYIWEIFRQQQIAMGIDPSQDYPANYGPESHAPFTPTGFGNLQNVFGINNMFTTQIYTYQPHPTCTFERPTCGFRYLTCDLASGTPMCLPITATARPVNPGMPPVGTVGPQINQGPGISPIGPGIGPGQNLPPGPAMGAPPLPFGRKRRAAQTSWEYEYKEGSRKIQQCSGSLMPYSSQNTFEINAVSDTRNWVFIPVRVVSKRSPENRQFNAYAIYDGFAAQDTDIYNPDSYQEIKPYFSENVMPFSASCKAKTGGQSVGRIHIRSDGLNYQGNYDEYVVVDLRQAFTESTTYIALKSPSDTPSEVLLSAFDACGRLCQPYCRNRNSVGGFHKCSGALKVTNATPWEFGKNYGDAVRMSWNLNDLDTIPQLQSEEIIIQFYCDHRK